MKRLLIGLILGCFASIILAQPVELKKGHPDTYHVKNGDTLWDISNVFLQDPWLWPEIWQLNPEISNPHLIFPGDKLALIYIDDAKNHTQAPKLTVVERGVVKLKPGDKKLQPQVRTSALDTAIPAIPLEKISAFLSKSRVVKLNELDDAPYVIAGQNKRLLSGAGDQLYARGNFTEGESVYGIYRPGGTYFDPLTQEALGVQALSIGSARIISRNNDVASLQVNASSKEIRINDRLLPNEERKVTATFIPKAPNTKINGLIIHVEDGVTQVASLDVVALNVGERDGLEIGDILAIKQVGEIVKDRVKNELIQLPAERAGLLIVFRTFEKMSYGLVVSSKSTLRIGDKVSNP